MGLKERVRRLEQLFMEGRIPSTLIVFGLAPAEQWDVGAQRYRSEQGVEFEIYATFGDLGESPSRARDLAQLRQLADTCGFRLVVYPSDTPIGDIWAAEGEAGQAAEEAAET